MKSFFWTLPFALLAFHSSSAGATSLPVLHPDWDLTTELDCVSPEDPRVRLRVVNHAAGDGGVDVLSVRVDQRIVAADSPLRQIFTPAGRSWMGRRLTLRLSGLPNGGLYGRLEGPSAGTLPTQIFHCRALR